MGLFKRFPYTNFHELNTEWLLEKMKELDEIVKQFIATESLKFADPIIWDITTQYQKSTIVLDPTGNAYLSVQPVPAGIQLNNDEYWLEIFNFTDYTRTANKNLTVNVETNTTRATAAYNVDDWLIWEDILYKVTSPIDIDDLLVIGNNLVHFTVEDFLKAFITYASGLIQQYKDDIDASELAYRQQLAQDIADTTASLQAQLDAAIAGVTVDSEVINARIGADGVTYSTLGIALRSQVSGLELNTIKKLKSIKYVKSSMLDKIDYIEELEIYVPDSYMADELVIKSLGYYEDEDRFYINVYNNTYSVSVGTLTHDYTSMPTSGIETLWLANNNPLVIKITINWSKYDTTKYVSNAQQSIVPAGAADIVIPYSLGSFKSGKPVDTIARLHYIKEFDVTVPSDVITHEFAIRYLGILTAEDAFYIGLYDLTQGVAVGLAYHVYDSVPTDGLEEINLTSGGYKYRVLVDWSEYTSADWYAQNNIANVNLYVTPHDIIPDASSSIIHGNNTNLQDITGSAVLQGTFYLNDEYVMSANQSLIGDGAVISVGSSAKLTLNDNCIIDGIRFTGTWVISRTTYRSGYTPLISLTDLENNNPDALWGTGKTSADAFIQKESSKGYNSTIRNCIFENFDRCAVRLEGGGHKSKLNAQVYGCYFSDCWMAIAAEGEFTRLTSNIVFRSIIGLYLRSGNVAKACNIFKCCDVGIYYPDASNNAHGETTSTEIAHCNVAGIYVKKILINCGEFYSGCQIVDAPIIAEESNSLLISGGLIDTYISIAAGQHNAIVNNVVGVGYKYGEDLYDVPADSVIRDNIPLYNATDAEINPV